MDANEAGSVSSNVGTQAPPNAAVSSRHSGGLLKLVLAHKKITISAVILLIALGAGIFVGQKVYNSNKAASPVASQFGDQKIALDTAVTPGSLQLNTAQALSINGQLRANNTLVLAPTTQPKQGTAGQLYYDSAARQIMYHNGQSFVGVADTSQTAELQSQLQGFASQAEIDDLTRRMQAVQSQLGQIQLPSNIAQLDAVNNFSAQNTFAAGLTASSLNVSGATALGSASASSLILSTPLDVSSGGTGQSSLPLNGVLIGQGTGPVISAIASGPGQCLVSTAGAPTFQPCPGGGNSVDSLNGLSGALTLANAAAAGSTITINDASTSAKGIASFNSSNFTVTAGAVNTVQNISVTATPSFAGLTLTGDLSLGVNNIVTSGAIISSTELNVLDGGIDESEVTGAITDVTAGNGLTGGASSGNATLNITSANGGIVVNADNIALMLQPSGDALSMSTSSGSGLEILAGGLSLLQGCGNSQVLKWDETNDVWGCADDAGGSGLGDDISVNSITATNANFIDTVASGSTAGVAWTLNTTPSPDDISITISNASGTQAGVVTTGIQSFAGDKTFNSAVNVSGLFTASGNLTVEAGDTFTINGDALTDLSGTGLVVVGGVLQASLGTSIESSEITDLTVTGADIANDTIALGTKTTGNFVAGNTGGTGIVITGSAGEGWSPTISLDYSSDLITNNLAVNQSSFAATGILFEGSLANAFETLFTVADPTADNTITLPNASGTVCLAELGNCAGSGSGVTTNGGTTNRVAKFNSAQSLADSTIMDDGTNVTTSGSLIIQGGNVTAGTNSQLGSFILNDGNGQTTTLRAGDSVGNLTFTLPTNAGSQFQCLKYNTGGQLIWDDCAGGSGGGTGVTSLNGLSGGVTIQGSSQIGVSASSPNINLTINADSVGDSQLAFNTGQHLTTGSAPTFAGLTLTGDLSLGVNNIVTSGAIISSTELNVLDGGIDESEVTGAITDVTAGNGLTGGASSGNATLNITSANGGIVVNADNIALMLQPSGDALSMSTSSGSGLEILAGGLSLLQGCGNSQVLKWDETNDVWMCANDVDTDTDTGDEVSVNGAGTTGANFINTIASGTSAGVTWNLNNTPSPDDISLVVSNASATEAGVVTTGIQSFSGVKTFGSQIVASGGIDLGTQTLTGTSSAIAFSNFGVLANGNTTVGGTLTVGQETTLNGNVSIAAGKSLTVTGGATGTRPSSPTEGMIYFDTTTKQLLTYTNGKWQADRSTSTKIIAPSNASQTAKDSADVVLTGTADQTLINTTLTSAAGGKVYILEGTVTITGAISVPNNTTLAGTGTSTLITVPNSLNTSINAITNTSIGGSGAGITIQDLRLDGNKANQTSGVMRGVLLDGAGAGTGASAISGGKIINVQAKSWRSQGFFLSSSSNNTLKGNAAQDNGSHGFSLSSSSNNTLNENTAGGNVSSGFSLASSSSNNILTGNVAQTNADNGFLLSSSSTNTLTNNISQSNTNYGFRIESGSNNVATSNTAQDNVNGFYLLSSSSSNTLSSNTIQDNSAYGVILSSSSSNKITDNSIVNTGGSADNNGIYLTNSDSNQITGNTISDSSATTTNYAINITSSTSDTNYLAGNTLGTGSVNNLGTGTIYGGQVNSSGNFVIQPAGTIELMKNTNVTGTLNVSSNGDFNGSLTVGSADQFVISSVGVVTSGTWQGGTIGLAYGGTNNTTYTTNGIVYSNGTALVSTAAGSTGQCLLAATGSAPTWGTCTATNLQGTYNASSPATIDLSNSKDFIINATDQTTDSSIVFNLQCVTCSASGGRFAIQDAGVDIFRINPNGDIILGTASNNLTLTASNGYKPVLTGTARNSKVIRLHAEYPNTVLDTGGTGANTGTMTSGNTAANRRTSYYNWTTTQGSAQSYDIVVQVPIPQDFDAWDGATPFTISGYTTHTTNGTVKVEVIKSNGSVDSNFSTFPAMTIGSADTWTTNSFALDSTSYSAGDYLTLRIRLTTTNGVNVRSGNITINYLSKF